MGFLCFGPRRKRCHRNLFFDAQVFSTWSFIVVLSCVLVRRLVGWCFDVVLVGVMAICSAELCFNFVGEALIISLLSWLLLIYYAGWC